MSIELLGKTQPHMVVSDVTDTRARSGSSSCLRCGALLSSAERSGAGRQSERGLPHGSVRLASLCSVREPCAGAPWARGRPRCFSAWDRRMSRRRTGDIRDGGAQASAGPRLHQTPLDLFCLTGSPLVKFCWIPP